MMTPSETPPPVALMAHNAEFRRFNAVSSAGLPPHDFAATPLDRLAAALPPGHPLCAIAATVRVRRHVARLVTTKTSFEVWSALTRFETLLADERRLAPRFRFDQLVGRPGLAAGNEYRTAVVDPARVAAIAAHGGDGAPRRMDMRVTRAGPWAGETAELTVETLVNHAAAGGASLWVVAHGTRPDGRMDVTLDTCELFRLAWAPDALAAAEGAWSVAIIDGERLIDRLASVIDADDADLLSGQSICCAAAPDALAADEAARDALAVHPALRALLSPYASPETAP